MIKVNIKTQQGVFKFFLKFFSFLCILFILDYTIGNLLKYLYFKQDSGSLYDITYSIDSTKAEILVLGSSTANHHYYPDAFESRLGMSFYNTGNDGTSLLYHYAILSAILKRYSPRIIILEFDAWAFNKKQESYDRLSSLLPYYYNHPEIRPIIELISPFEKMKLSSKIYPFNSMLYSVVIRNPYFKAYNKNREISNEGYIPLDRIWNKPIQSDTTDLNYELDENKIKYFNAFIKDCIDSDVDLYIVSSPRYIKKIRKDLSIELAKQIANKSNIPFFNYSDDTLFLKHREYFNDQVHLNNTGAIIFSNIIIDTIIKSREYRHMKNGNNF